MKTYMKNFLIVMLFMLIFIIIGAILIGVDTLIPSDRTLTTVGGGIIGFGTGGSISNIFFAIKNNKELKEEGTK